MQTFTAGLLNSVVSVYDKTKTTIFGRVFQKTISSISVLGPPLTNFIDVYTDTTGGGSVTPSSCYLTQNGRLFVVNTPAAGVMAVLLYNFDLTGQSKPSYVGRIIVNVPNTAATTHVNKFLKVYDGLSPATVTGWKIAIGTTGSVLINGGTFIVNNVALADFVPVSPPTFGMAIASNAKSVYMAQDPGNIGVNNNLTAFAGGAIVPSTQQLYTETGLAAAANWITFDLTVSPTVNNTYSTPQASTTLYGGTSPAAYFELPSTASAGFAANDPVVLVGTVPTNFTASTASAQTVYFIRDIQSIAGTTYFNLAATSGGAAVVPTSNVTSGMSIMRAFGQSTSYWTSVKTGNIAGIAGTITLLNSMKYMNSADPNLPVGLQNQDCFFFSTTTGLYAFKISDITNGATTFPSMSSVNVTGTGIDYTAEATIASTYSNEIQQAIYASNTSQFYAKSWQNSVIKQSFGGLSTEWYEAQNPMTTVFAAAAITNIETQKGWLLATATTAGQRGIYFMDLESDDQYGYSYITSPVLSTLNEVLEYLATVEALFDVTDSINFSYKTAATSGDAIFTDPTTGWTATYEARMLNTALQAYTQFRFGFQIATLLANTPAQINELTYSAKLLTESSNYWEGSVDNTTQSGTSPQYVAFRQIAVYGTLPSKLIARGIDDSGNIIQTFDTSSSLTPFSQSNNNGTSWSALGSIGSLYNVAFTSEVRVIVSSPSGTRLTWSLSES